MTEHKTIFDRHNALKFTIDQWMKIMNNNDNNDDNLFKSFLFLIDNMKDELLVSFNTIPERIVILHQNQIVYKSSYFTDSIFEMEEIEQRLNIFAN